MARIMAIDYGAKRCGLAVTDPLQTCAFGLDTVLSSELLLFIKTYTQQEEVVLLVVGEPKQRDNSPSLIESQILTFIDLVKQQFPLLPIVRFDERYTSKMAQQILLQSGAPKKIRKKKEVVDKLSATLILQGYLDQHQRI